MRILALEPYYGGSHRAFLDGWIAHSRHRWTVLGLPAFKWKWRMRHAPITFADEVAERVESGGAWDVVFCSDMLNLAECRGLTHESVRHLPAVAYFHENQLTYPVRVEDERDYQYCFSNIATALAADAAWFNSAFHRDEFLDAIPRFLEKLPDHQAELGAVVARIRQRAAVHPPGIEPIDAPGRAEGRAGAPLRILWAARWEFDKAPEVFFEAVRRLRDRGIAFRLSVIGEQFRARPAVFDRAQTEFAGRIDRWGYQEGRAAYERALAEADVVVSTALHEFFGISIVEAVAAGCYPVVPRRLAYPEVLGALDKAGSGPHFYDGGAEELAGLLGSLAERDDLWQGDSGAGVRAVSGCFWATRAPALDDAIQEAGR
ncbi:MAG: tRNA-queuosine alpha-mannosyltransferase domain-containing protein [Planctomycetota bacterium]